MQKSDVVFRLFIPANEDPSKTVQPTMRPFHHPASGLFAGFVFDFLGLLSTGTNMFSKTKLFQDVPNLLIIIALVQTHALRLLGGWLRTLHHDIFDRIANQFHVVTISSLHRQPNRHALPFGQQTPFNPTFGPISRIRSGFFFHLTALWSLLRPYLTIPNQFLLARQTAPSQLATASKTPRLGPILDSGRGRLSQHTGPFHPELSIGNPCVGQRKCHRHTVGLGHVVALRQSDGYSHAPAKWAAPPSTVHRKLDNLWWFCYSVFFDVFV